VIRYPIRMKEDLLPVQMLFVRRYRSLLEQFSVGTGCRMDSVQIPDWSERQLRLPVPSHCTRRPRNAMAAISTRLGCCPSRTLISRALCKSRFDMREGLSEEEGKKTKTKIPLVEPGGRCHEGSWQSNRQDTNLISDCIAAGGATTLTNWWISCKTHWTR